MRKQVLFLYLFSCICCSNVDLLANSPALHWQTKEIHSVMADSIPYLTSADTIFIERNDFGEKIYTHTLQPGQTIWSLARFYGLKPDELNRFNPSFEGKVLSPGTKVRIPIPNAAIKRYQNESWQKEAHVPICYRVKRGDTMFGIAMRDYKMPVDTLINRNNLHGQALQLGQILQTGWLPLTGVPDSLQNHKLYASWDKDSRAAQQFEIDRKKYNQRGPAVWMKEQARSGKKMAVALHSFAKIGSVIEVRNPMNNRVAYTKVIGRIPAGAYDPNVITVLSPLAAKMLGARDKTFFVEIKYKK